MSVINDPLFQEAMAALNSREKEIRQKNVWLLEFEKKNRLQEEVIKEMKLALEHILPMLCSNSLEIVKNALEKAKTLEQDQN